jgi:hypothetical protein
MGEMDAANKAGMTARKFAKSRGVPSTLTDAEAAAADAVNYSMAEGEGIKITRTKAEYAAENDPDFARKVDSLNQYAADNNINKLFLSTEDILKTSGGRTDLAKNLILATKEIVPGKTVSEIYKMLKISDSPGFGSLSSYQARIWYLYQESRIKSRLDYSKSLKQVAGDAVDIRNWTRTRTREIMSDRGWAKFLTESDPNRTFEELVDYYSEKYSGDALWNKIIESATRSRDSINKLFGIILGG